jgi:hypothetical protein
LSERISGYGSISYKKGSVHVFKHNEKWYKVSTKVEEVTLNNSNNNATQP